MKHRDYVKKSLTGVINYFTRLVSINFHDRGVFSNFERARKARAKIDENIEVVKVFCRQSGVFGFTVCLMRYLILVLTNFHYIKLKIWANI